MKVFLILLFGLTAHLSSSFAESAQPLQVNIQGARYFSQKEYDKLMAAKKLIEVVVNSADFKTAVTNFTYNGQKAFVQNNGLTNEQVFSYLMLGAEKFPTQTPEDHLMDFDIELYTSSWFGRGTLGYTNQDTKTIHINTRFYDGAAVNEIAMNMVHEWTHKMGFDHDSNRTARRDYSVPYAVGYLVRDLGKKLTTTSTLP